jgi:hypothetical protein
MEDGNRPLIAPDHAAVEFNGYSCWLERQRGYQSLDGQAVWEFPVLSVEVNVHGPISLSAGNDYAAQFGTERIIFNLHENRRAAAAESRER